MLDDEQKIILKAQKGEAECFGLLYDHYVAQIYRFVLIKVSHHQEAEDLTHEVFLKAWQNINNFNQRGFPFSSWLYRIARNRVIDYYRTRKEALSIDEVSEYKLKLAATFDQELDHQASLDLVKTAIKQLNDEQQNIIILRFVEDLSTTEIAQITNKSEGAVRLMQYRAIRNLKNILNNEESI
jgi:RNA polymerase sigma-70 factor (ECF subfamily)